MVQLLPADMTFLRHLLHGRCQLPHLPAVLPTFLPRRGHRQAAFPFLLRHPPQPVKGADNLPGEKAKIKQTAEGYHRYGPRQKIQTKASRIPYYRLHGRFGHHQPDGPSVAANQRNESGSSAFSSALVLYDEAAVTAKRSQSSLQGNLLLAVDLFLRLTGSLTATQLPFPQSQDVEVPDLRASF